jgi:hypothetical protein
VADSAEKESTGSGKGLTSYSTTKATDEPPSTGNPTSKQFRRVLVKAIAAGLLSIDESLCFVFHSSTGEESLLGKDAEAVYGELHPPGKYISDKYDTKRVPQG